MSGDPQLGRPHCSQVCPGPAKVGGKDARAAERENVARQRHQPTDGCRHDGRLCGDTLQWCLIREPVALALDTVQ